MNGRLALWFGLIKGIFFEASISFRGLGLMNNYKKNILVPVLAGFFLATPVFAADGSRGLSSEAIEKEVNQLYSEAADLERDIGLLEKDLLFPPLTRVEVFLSIDATLNFTLKNVVLSLDGDEKSFHIYTATDMTALQMGGLQQFWEGNVALGQHEVVVEFQGVNAKGKRVKQSVSQKFEKTRDGLAFEIQVKQGANATTPTFAIKAWNNR